MHESETDQKVKAQDTKLSLWSFIANLQDKIFKIQQIFLCYGLQRHSCYMLFALMSDGREIAT